MSVAIDAQSAVQHFQVAYNTVASWSHTVAGSQRALYVLLGVSVEAALTQIAGVTFGGVALTNVGRDTMNNGPGDRQRAEVWRLTAPAVGTGTIAVTGQASEYTSGYTVSLSLTGVDQTTPEDTAVARGTTAASTAPSLSITTTAVGNLCLATFVSAETPAAGNTSLSTNYDTTYLFGVVNEYATPSGSSQSMSATSSVTSPWAAIALDVNAAAAGGLTRGYPFLGLGVGAGSGGMPFLGAPRARALAQLYRSLRA